MKPRTRLYPGRHGLFICMLAVLAAPPLMAFADEDEAARTLDTLHVTADALDRDDARQKTVSTATKMEMARHDVPQTINTLDMSKSKVYGFNDLSVLLDGTPGVDTGYDMRGDGIGVRGFAADSNDVYRDGVRNAGQIRRSTANVERIEIVKGPASVLYGRGLGGGVVNLISKQASFDALSSINLRGGSWANRGATVDVNEVPGNTVAVRLTADFEQGNSFRRGSANRNRMISPSILFDNKEGFSWLAQFTYDSIWRRPDRAPAFDALPDGVSKRTAYAHPDDFVIDDMQSLRSVLNWRFSDNWSVKWTAAWNESSQNFDHFYAGSYCRPDGTRLSNGAACTTPGLMTFARAWQETSNSIFSNTVDISGGFDAGKIAHTVLIGMEDSREQRNPDLATSGSDRSLLYPGGVDPFNPVWSEHKVPHGPATTSNRHRAESQALYAQDLIGLGDHWKVLAGVRFDRFTFRTRNKISGQQRGYRGTTLSPRLGVIWQPLTAHSLYASYSKNFAPYGGRGLMSVSVNDSTVYDAEPQYSRQYEIGVKNDWQGDRLSSQLSVYELELYNIRYRPDPDNDPYTWAVRGSERSRGVEASVAGRLLAGLYVRGGFGLLEAKIGQDLTTPANEGRYKRGVARKTGNLFVRYAPDSDWYGELGVTYRGPVYNDLANTSERAGYTRWDASLGWRPLPWTVTLAVTNLFDTDYWRSTSMPGTPRGILLSVNRIL